MSAIGSKMAGQILLKFLSNFRLTQISCMFSRDSKNNLNLIFNKKKIGNTFCW